MIQIYQQKKILLKELPLKNTYALLAFFAGVFLSSFDILTHARFLEVFGYKYLASSYIIGGVFGTILTFLYSLLFRRIRTKTFNFIIASFILISAGVYLFANFYISSNIIAYYGMVLLFPLNTILLISLWRFARKLITPRQSRDFSTSFKRSNIIGLVFGGLLASLVAYLFPILKISIICITALIFYWLSHFILYKRHSDQTIFKTDKEKFVPVSNNILLFFTSPISTYLFLFGLLSAIVGFSIHFTFINIAAAGFNSVVGLSKFYGLYIGALMVFIYFMDKYLIKKILYANDSPYSLVLIPIVLLIVITFTIVVYHFFAGLRPHEHFTVFFLLLALAKIGYESIRHIIQVPSIRTLFQTLDIRYKQSAYPRIEGTVIMLGLLISGLVILGISFLPIFNLNLIMYWTAAITLIWIIISIQLVRKYRQAQEKSLTKLRYNKTGLISESIYEERLWKTFTGKDIVKIRFLLNSLRKIHPASYEEVLNRLLAQPNKEVRKIVVEDIVLNRINKTLSSLQKYAEDEVGEEKGFLLNAIYHLKEGLIISKPPEQLREIVFNGSFEEKLQIANSISYSLPEYAEEFLLELIKDIEPEINNVALRSLARLKNIKFSYSLIDFLYPDKYNSYSLAAIANSGNDAVDFLLREQILPGTPSIVKSRITKLYGRIGTQKSIDLILSNIANQDRFVMQHSLQSLIDCHFQANPGNKYKLLSFLIKQIGVVTQSLHFYKLLKNKKRLVELAEAYRQEIDNNYELTFKILSIIYNPAVIESIRNLCLEGSHSDVNHAIELVDHYVDEDLKPVLFPLIEDISLNERLKKLEHYFIQSKIKTNEIITHILTADFNTLSLYPRACALMYIYNNQLSGYSDELVFNAYHSEPLLSETAVFILSKMHPHVLDEILNDSTQDFELKQLINKTKQFEEQDLFYQRFITLKKFAVFNEFSENAVLQLAHNAQLVKLNKDEPFDLMAINAQEGLLLTDSLTLKGDNNYVISSIKNFVDVNLVIKYGITQIIPEKDTEIWLFPNSVTQELLFDHVDFANNYFMTIEELNVELSK